MLQIKRKSGTYHSSKVLDFVSRPAQNRHKPKHRAYPGDVIKVKTIPGGGKNDDQWEVLKGNPEDGYERIKADDGTEVGKREKRKRKPKLPTKKDLENKDEYTNVTTKHDGDVEHYINNETGEDFILHPDGKVEAIDPDKKEKIEFTIEKSKKDPKKWDVINPETGEPINDVPLTKKEAAQLV